MRDIFGHHGLDHLDVVEFRTETRAERCLGQFEVRATRRGVILLGGERGQRAGIGLVGRECGHFGR